MTAVWCEQPAFRLADAYPTASLDPREIEVEDALQARHDLQDHDLALQILATVRPDLTVAQLDGWISELLDLADGVRLAGFWRGGDRHVDAAIDRYESALHVFALGSTA